MINQINERLKVLISKCKEPLLKEVMLYTALGEGKRLRPQLLLASCEAVLGGYNDIALDFACAIEMIHAYSLAHDDLPAMDNDDYRRGRPTTHKTYDEAMAILAGDGLLSLAVEVMANRIDARPDGLRAALALNHIIKGAGVNGMVGGQVSDILNEGKPIDAETLDAIYIRKTGGLIIASLEAGAILGGGCKDLVTAMAKLGQAIGIAFQIRDDILDVTSTADTLGKPIGSDVKNQKSTYVSIHGLAASETEYARLNSEAIAILDTLSCKTNTLGTLISQTIARTK